MPVRMCSGEGGMPGRLLTSEYLKYFIIQIASGHFGWNRIIKAMPNMVTDPAAILIKIGQGASPATAVYCRLKKSHRTFKPFAAAQSRSAQPAQSSGTVQHRGKCSEDVPEHERRVQVPRARRDQSGGQRYQCLRLQQPGPRSLPHRGRFFLDGIQGGTGAAHEVSLDHTGHPILSKLRDCYLDAVSQGRQGHIPLFVGGGFGDTGDLAADAFKAVCLGASGVFAPKSFADRGLRGE